MCHFFLASQLKYCRKSLSNRGKWLVKLFAVLIQGKLLKEQSTQIRVNKIATKNFLLHLPSHSKTQICQKFTEL